jgi:Flp pilus assembly protein TadD
LDKCRPCGKRIWTSVSIVQDCESDANQFNTYGYDLLSQRRSKDALVIFEITAWAHPTSANAQDSLADACVAIGDKEKARTAIQRAIELAATDSTIGAESKDSFIVDEHRRLEELK